MANRQRGDQEITINGRTILLRPSFEAIAQIEEKTGESFMDLANDIIGMAREFRGRATGQRSVKGAKIAHMAIMIAEGARAGGEFVDTAVIGKEIIKEGMAGFLPALTAFASIPLAGINIDEDPAEGNGHTGPEDTKTEAGTDDVPTGEQSSDSE